ncbi:MAG: type II secretion system protein [Clostridium sp.]
MNIIIRNKGFTLIEMICTVAIITILSSIAIPVSLDQIRKVTDRRYLIEGKLIENAIEIYNVETPGNKIKQGDSLSSIKVKLTGSTKKYIIDWPTKIRVIEGSEEVNVESDKLDSYTIENLSLYTRKQEGKL